MHVKYLRRNLSLLAIIAAGMLAAGIATGIQSRTSEAPRIDFFDVQKSNFVAETHGLKRMEIWAIPEDAKGEQEWNTIGLMKRTSHWFSWSQWSLPIPNKPIPAMQIIVRGYDASATEMDRVTLPWTREETLREKLRIEN